MLSRHGHDDVIKWKHFPRYWPFVRGIHRSPVNSPHKGQWHGALMFSLICAWVNSWVNNREADDRIRHRAHYDVIVMFCTNTTGMLKRMNPEEYWQTDFMNHWKPYVMSTRINSNAYAYFGDVSYTNTYSHTSIHAWFIFLSLLAFLYTIIVISLSLQRRMSINVREITGNSIICSKLVQTNNKEIIKDPHYWPLSSGFST